MFHVKHEADAVESALSWRDFSSESWRFIRADRPCKCGFM